jgi:hypothetical protein
MLPCFGLVAFFDLIGLVGFHFVCEATHNSCYLCSMATDMILESLQNDLEQVGATLQKLAQVVIDDGISDFPVFVAAHEFVQIGKPVFDLDDVQIDWFFNISTLEEFFQKDIIKSENLNRFRRTYSDPRQKACIFVITQDDARIVFVPYQKSVSED